MPWPQCVLAAATLLLSAGSVSPQAPPIRFSPLQPVQASGAFLDLDGDGDLDALGGAAWENDGHGNFIPMPVVGPLIGEPVLADVDGDGDLDVLAQYGEGPRNVPVMRLLTHDGAGGFTDRTADLPDRYGVDAAFGDVDGDGDLDLVVAAATGNGGSRPLQDLLWLNDGSGRFVDATDRLPQVATASTAVALGDVDGDGDVDILIGISAYFADGQNLLWLNDGRGFFRDATNQLPRVGDDTAALEFYDVEGDGDLDALSANALPWGSRAPAQNQLWLNDGSGRFIDGTAQVPQRLDGSWSLAVGDFDADGDPDVLFGGGLLWRNVGQGRFVDGGVVLAGAAQVQTNGVGDADGDGDLDVLSETGVWLNDSSGRFGAFRRPSLDVGVGALTGDLDADGDVDILAADGALWSNDGIGGFSRRSPPFGLPGIPADEIAVMALGDLDGDGDLDVMVGTESFWTRDPNRLFLNDGAGRFRDASNLIPLDDDIQVTEIELGDVDGDGDLDAVLADRGVPGGPPGRNRLWRNDGAGRFVDAPAALPSSLLSTCGVELGDVDGDGDLDLVVGTGIDGSAQDRLWLNDGSGLFLDATARLPQVATSSTQALVLGDVDGDGDLDLVLGQGRLGPTWSTGLQNLLWLNDGAGTFSDASFRLPQREDFTWSLQLVDLDDDGDLDLVEGPSGVLRNDGAGRFHETGVLVGGVGRIADLDGDGDLDALPIFSGAPQFNLMRQLACRQLARPGSPLTLELFGEPGVLWLLSAAPRSARIQIPSFGTLGLDPATIEFVGGGSFDHEGHATQTLPVPADPNLIGATLHWQGLVDAPIRLTNVVRTTFVGY